MSDKGDIKANNSQKAQTARILRGVGGRYLISQVDFRGYAAARGIFRKDGIVPTPGDLVEYESSGDPDIPWVITAILPRTNYLIRPAVANLDRMFITAAATEPAADFYLLDKLIVISLINQIEPVLIITKNDLAASEPAIFRENYEPAGIAVIFTAIDDDSSHAKINQLLKQKIVTFAGQSGAGKSTLLNQLFGVEKMETGDLSDRLGRGKHTTRHVELFPFRGGYLADTPGFSTLELADLGIRPELLEQGYPELIAVSDRCRFRGCRHSGDLGCAVSTEIIHPDRLERYRQLRKMLEEIEPFELAQRDSSGQFGSGGRGNKRGK